MHKTLGIVKPDVYARTGAMRAVRREIARNGFSVLDSMVVQFDEQMVNEFYAEHRSKSFFKDILEYMTSGPAYAMLLGRMHEAVDTWRDLIGPTLVEKAQATAHKSLRARFGTKGGQNGFHGSDSLISANREIHFFFPNARLPIECLPPSKNYLDQTLTPVLQQALIALCNEKPADPFVFLADWLSNNNPNKPISMPVAIDQSSDIRIVFVLGSPGSGKCLYCQWIAEECPGIAHYSVGDLLRSEVDRGSSRGTPISRAMKEGTLVETEIVMPLVCQAINTVPQGTHTILLSGFPRSLEQATQFEEQVKPCEFVLSLEHPPDRVYSRTGMSSRKSLTRSTGVTPRTSRRVTFEKETVPIVSHFDKIGKVVHVIVDASKEAAVREQLVQLFKV
ncbi:UMP-CMP kinase 3 [Pelomyxa schiedti]|nr:UMP-CMP kinase 3 [Pelomyxa schiedti]